MKSSSSAIHPRATLEQLFVIALAAFMFCALAAPGAALAPSHFVEEDVQEKKRKKQRGKTVKATLVPSTPAESEEDAAEAPAAESSEAAEESVAAESRAEAKEAKRERERAERAERAAAKEAEREAEREAKDARRAERQAAREEERAAKAAEQAGQSEQTVRSATSRSSSSAASSSSSSSASAATVAEPTASAAAPSRPAAAPAATSSSAATSRSTATTAADPPRRRATAPPTRPRDIVRENVVVREVLLDVQVNGADGEPVTGLGPEDFVVTEGGAQREVTSATFYGASEFSGSGVDGEARSDRYFIFLFDDLRLIDPRFTSSLLDASRWAVRWLEDGMLPNDQIAVLGYSNRLKLYQDFTRDRQEIADAIMAAGRGGKGKDLWKSRSGPEFDPDSPSLFANMPTGKALSKATPRMQKALELLGNAAEGIAGRKNLVLFSLGFGESRGSFGNYVPDPRYYPPMEQALNNGNVAVYAVNPLGATRGGNTISGITESLSAIATDTGGQYYSNHINVKAPLSQVSDDNRAYYLISYRTEYSLGDAGYREVTVDVQASGAKVEARKGYRFGEAE